MDIPNKSKTYSCPECDNPITYSGEVKIGTIVECTACGCESEFLSLSPIKLAPLEEEK